jgi:hypothetical protein
MTMFQKLDELNRLDAEQGGKRVILCPDIIDVNSGKKNGTVRVGVPTEVAQELINGMVFGRGSKKAVLMIIDMDEFNKILTPLSPPVRKKIK